MTGNDVACLPIERLAPRIENRELTASELVDRMLARIEAHDSKIEAFTHVSEHARATAARLDDEIRRGTVPGSTPWHTHRNQGQLPDRGHAHDGRARRCRVFRFPGRMRRRFAG